MDEKLKDGRRFFTYARHLTPAKGHLPRILEFATDVSDWVHQNTLPSDQTVRKAALEEAFRYRMATWKNGDPRCEAGTFLDEAARIYAFLRRGTRRTA